MPDYYMGVDPGQSTGIAIVSFQEFEEVGWEVFQVYGTTAMWLLDQIFSTYAPRVVAVEEFVPSNRAGTKGKDAQLTRLIADYALTSAPAIKRIPRSLVVARRAIDIKPWATDKRMEKTGFPWGTKFKDARDAGRHALYAAVRDGKERDPLY